MQTQKQLKNIKHNQPIHRHDKLWPHIGGHFITPTFQGGYPGISDTLNIRKTDYYKPKGGQTINLQKDPYFKEVIKKIKISVLRIAEHYFKVKPGYKVDVVSLWLNSNEKNISHSPHNHMNTFISGVLWLDGKENEYPDIKFLRPYALPNLPIISKYNEMNSNIIRTKARKDDIVFFPSYLFHFVERNTSRKPRISLAFDTILRGRYGEIGENNETVGQYKI